MYGYLFVSLEYAGKMPDQRGAVRSFSETPDEITPQSQNSSYAILEVEADGDYEGGLIGEIKNCRPIKIVLHFPAEERVTFLQKVAHFFGKHILTLRRTDWDLLKGLSAEERICPLCHKLFRQETSFPKGELCR